MPLIGQERRMQETRLPYEISDLIGILKKKPHLKEALRGKGPGPSGPFSFGQGPLHHGRTLAAGKVIVLSACAPNRISSCTLLLPPTSSCGGNRASIVVVLEYAPIVADGTSVVFS